MDHQSIFQIGKSIQVDRERLKKLEKGILPGAPPVSDTEAYSLAIAELKGLIQARINEYLKEYVRLSREFDAIDDPYAKQLFIMHYVEGDSAATIARKLNMTPTTIKSDMCRYRKKYGIQYKAKHPRMRY